MTCDDAGGRYIMYFVNDSSEEERYAVLAANGGERLVAWVLFSIAIAEQTNAELALYRGANAGAVRRGGVGECGEGLPSTFVTKHICFVCRCLTRPLPNQSDQSPPGPMYDPCGPSSRAVANAPRRER